MTQIHKTKNYSLFKKELSNRALVPTALKKLIHKADAIRPCTSRTAYYIMLRDIYNWRNENPLE